MKFCPYSVFSARNEIGIVKIQSLFLHPKIDRRNAFLLLPVSNLKYGAKQTKGLGLLVL